LIHNQFVSHPRSPLLQLSQRSFHSPIRRLQFFRQHARLTHDTGEIRISRPPGDHVKMEMLADSSARCRAEVHSQIEAFRAIQLLQSGDGSLRELHHFCELIDICSNKVIEMLVWRNHQMAGRIWKQIEDYKIAIATKDNEPFRIPARIVSDTKHTSGGFLSARRQIIVAPWAPDEIHARDLGFLAIRKRGPPPFHH
jgi:hypothetical protein